MKINYKKIIEAYIPLGKYKLRGSLTIAIQYPPEEERKSIEYDDPGQLQIELEKYGITIKKREGRQRSEEKDITSLFE